MRTRLLAIAASLALGAATITGAAIAAPQHFGGGGGGGFSPGGGGRAGAVSGGGSVSFNGGGRTFGGNAAFNGGGRSTFNGSQGFASPRTGMSNNVATTRGNFARGNFAVNRTGPTRNFAGGNVAANNWNGRGDWRFRHRGRFFGPGVGLFAFGGFGPDYYDYYDSDYAYDNGCWQRRLVPTPFGWRWRLVDVC